MSKNHTIFVDIQYVTFSNSIFVFHKQYDTFRISHYVLCTYLGILIIFCHNCVLNPLQFQCQNCKSLYFCDSLVLLNYNCNLHILILISHYFYQNTVSVLTPCTLSMSKFKQRWLVPCISCYVCEVHWVHFH